MKKTIFIISLFIIFINIPACTSNQNTKQSNANGAAVTNVISTNSAATTRVTSDSSASENVVKTLSYSDLIPEERLIYDEIRNNLKKNKKYSINFFDNSIQGIIKYDFNADGIIEELKYYTKIDETNHYTRMIKVQINNTYVEKEQTGDYGGINSLAIIDADKTDDYVEIVISEGELSDRTNNIFYRFDGEKFHETGNLIGSILDYTGDGKIYYWGGNLYEPGYFNEFDSNMALIYYDIKTNRKYTTDQILGKTFISDRAIILYKSKEDVVSGAPIEHEAILEAYKEGIIREMKAGEKFTVLNIDGLISNEEFEGKIEYFNNDNGVLIKNEKGETGWIGGFHMVWD